MANQTIYPFGTDGSLPSSVGVINDFTTGGADKALSAEMGKILGELVGVPLVDVDLSGYTKQYCSLGGSGWYRKNQGKQRHIAVPVTPGEDIILSVTSYGGSTTGTDVGWYVFVTSSYSPPYSNGDTIPKVGEDNRISAPLGQNLNLQVPEGAAYLILTTCDGADAQVTWALMLYEQAEDTLTERISETESELSDLLPVVMGTPVMSEALWDSPAIYSNNGVYRYYDFATDVLVPGSQLSLKLNDYTTYRCSAVVYSQKTYTGGTIVYDTGWQSGDVSLEIARAWEGKYLRIVMSKYDDSEITLQEGQQAISELSFLVPHGENGLVEKVDTLMEESTNPISRITPKVLNSYTYVGEKIQLAPTFSHEQIGTVPMGNNYRQGGAVFGDYFFQFYNTCDAIGIVDLLTGNTVQVIPLTPNANNHANTGGFSSQYYDSSDPFPVLYISSQDEHTLYAYRITGNVGEWQATVIQQIVIPECVYFPNVIIDTESNRGVIVGYALNTWQSGDGNNLIVYCFDLPSVLLGNVTIPQSALYNKFTLPFLYANQGGTARDGKFYMTFGNTGSGLKIGGLVVVDYINKTMLSHVDFKVLGSLEPESIGIWGQYIVFSDQAGKLHKLTF